MDVLVSSTTSSCSPKSSIWSCLGFSSSSDIPVVQHSTTCAEDWRFHGTGTVLGGVRHARRCATTDAGERSVQAALESQLQCSGGGNGGWGGGRQAVFVCFQLGVGAHHAGNELM